MQRYRMTPDGVRDVDTSQDIPADAGNRHWQAYQKWVMAGNVADPEALPEPDSNEIKLDKSDKRMVRVLDWLLQELVKNGTIRISDVPAPLRALYNERKLQRGG